MKQLIIDRFEGIYAICEDDVQKLFAIEIADLPKGAKEGDILEISDSGAILINAKETKNRRTKITKLQDSLWK